MALRTALAANTSAEKVAIVGSPVLVSVAPAYGGRGGEAKAHSMVDSESAQQGGL